MLRGLFVGLLLANLAYALWNEGWLEALGLPQPRGDREPHRLAAQLNPGAVVPLPADAASMALRAARAAELRCMQAGPFTGAEADAAEAMLRDAGVPAGAWARETGQPGQAWLRAQEPGAALRGQLQAALGGVFRACGDGR